MLCPYCKERELIRATCGEAKCQHEHHKRHMREYAKQFYLKFGKKIKPIVENIIERIG